MFRALAVHLHDNDKLEEKTSKAFNFFLLNCRKGDPSRFQGVHMNVIPKVEDSLHPINFLYDIDFVDGEIIGELARRSFRKYENSVKLLRYNNQICYVININAL